ncbi:MAG: glycine cleavage system protein GcvH [Anaerolineae bacterium]
MKIHNYEFPDDLYYDRLHGWVRVEGEIATQGTTDYAQAIAGEIVYVEVPRVGRTVSQGQPFMSMESGKWVGRIHALLSGEIVEANEDLEFEPELVQQDPYGRGWLVKIKISDPGELDNLLRASDPEYQAFMAAEREKYKDVERVSAYG